MSGTVLRLKAATHYGDNGTDSVNFKAHAGTVMVAVVLGAEELKHPKADFDFVAAMAKLGYQPMGDNLELLRLRAVEAAAKRYVASVNGGPAHDIWDTENGEFEEGASRVASDSAWRSYDEEKQNAFDALASTLESEPVPVA
jgi:hypothetical protein